MEKSERRFLKKLTALLEAGVPPEEALETLREEFAGVPLGVALDEVLAGVEQGRDADECMEEQPGLLHDLKEAGAELQAAGQEIGRGFESLMESLREMAGTLPAMQRQWKRRRKLRKVQRQVRRAMQGGLEREDEDIEVEVKVRVRDPQEAEAAGAATEGAAALLREAAAARASDVHVDATETGGRVRLRVDGVLQTLRTLEPAAHRALLRELKRLARMDLSENALPQDGRVRLRIEADGSDETMDVRVAVGPTVHGEAASLRLLRSRMLEEVLGSPGSVLQENLRAPVLELARRHSGLVFVTGPTGCGKTSTLYSLLASMDRESLKVMSVEDPVELVLDGVHQIPVAPGRGLSFPAAIRHALRMDPDVLYCSEVRDVETASLLLKTALTGHLVLAGLHAATAPDAVLRMLDIGLEPYLLADALLGVVGQRLVRRLSPAARVEAPEHTARLEELLGRPLPEGVVPMGPGDAPGNTGFQGRVAVQELLQVTPEVRRVLQRRPSPGELEAVARREGYRTLLENGLERVVAGTTSLTELLRVCS